MKLSLRAQIDRLETARRVLNARTDVDGNDLLGPAIATLTWLEANKEKLDLAVLIYKNESVRAVLEAFPGAQIDAVRPIDGYYLDTED